MNLPVPDLIFELVVVLDEIDTVGGTSLNRDNTNQIPALGGRFPEFVVEIHGAAAGRDGLGRKPGSELHLM